MSIPGPLLRRERRGPDAAPVIVNILAFHVLLAPSGVGCAVVVLAFEVYLAWAYRAA